MLSEILASIRADVCCVVIILLLYVKSFQTLGLANNAYSVRRIMFVAVVYIISYSVEELIMAGLIVSSRWVNTIILLSILFSQSILCYAWFIYTQAMQNSRMVDKLWKRWLLFLPGLLFGIMLLCSIKTNWIFEIKDDGSYARGSVFWIQYVIIALYLLSATAKAFFKSLEKKNFVIRAQLRTLSAFVIAPVLSTVYQFFSPNTFMAGIGITIAIVVLYINLQYESISLDDLTRVNNRQQMIRFLSQQITNKSENLYLIILDADNFKMINDTYGHIEGDNAIIHVADALRTVAAKYHCFISRYGGDEFIVICETDSEQKVSELAVDVNKELKRINEDAGTPYSLSVSVGYAKCPDNTIAIPDFIQMADRNLYLAKRAGKVHR